MSTNVARAARGTLGTLKHYLCRSLLGNIVSEESAVHTVFLLLNGHRELLERLVVKATVREDAGVLACQRPLVVFAGEERNRLAALPTPSCQPHNEPRDPINNYTTYLCARSGGCSPQSSVGMCSSPPPPRSGCPAPAPPRPSPP